jgi:prepilin-type N-terminal cleavage/methylation domain-containing protein
MRYQIKRHHRTVGNAGFTMVECLIGLAISAMLMTALAVAFSASVTNYYENEQMFESINNARQALTRMTSELRGAGYADPNLGWMGVRQAVPSNQCEFYTPAGEHIIYEYRDASDATSPNTLVLIKGGTAYTLCDDVTAASFSKTPADSDPLSSKSVLISLTVQCGHRERTLSAAAVVRRALEI